MSQQKVFRNVIVRAALVAALVFVAHAQDRIRIDIMGGTNRTIAIPDMRGSGQAADLMGTLNETLFREIQDSGLFNVTAKSFLPLNIPQQPRDFKGATRKGKPTKSTEGLYLSDWKEVPTSADYFTIGYTAEQNGQLVLFGWLFSSNVPDVQGAQVFGKLYLGTLDADGARKVAEEFAADILGQFGSKSLYGSKIYYASSVRPGIKEIWSMDWDGSNQKQFTHYNSISTMPAVSPDGTKVAFTTFYRGNPSIAIFSVETGRQLLFYNQKASMNATPDFTPDGTQLLFASTLSGWMQLYISNLDGTGLKRLTYSQAVEVEPKVNPKNGREIVFISGRSGPAQLYKMNLDGTDLVRLTSGEGDVGNPSWSPDGRHVAFCWTKGFAPGNWNIFIMDVSSGETVQLTHGQGRNENPVWGPDGRHLVFSSNRSGSSQIWTMLADGTQLRQLTTRGRNETPVWTR
jgi:TolB protein